MAETGIRIAVGQFNELTDEKLRFAAQIGVTGMQMNTPNLPGETHWEEEDLRALVDKCQEYGLKFEAIENVPIHFYDKAMLGLPGRDEQIEQLPGDDPQCRPRRHPDPRLPLHAELGLAHRAIRAGPRRRRLHRVRHGRGRQGGGGPMAFAASSPSATSAKTRSPCSDKEDDIVTEEQMWANYDYFIKAVLPVAEEAGVKLALHPDDPPVPMLGGVARLFKRAVRASSAPTSSTRQPVLGRSISASAAARRCRAARRTCSEMIEYFGPKGAHLLHPLPRRAGHGAELHRVLHRRRQLRSRRDDGCCSTKNGFTASCSTTTCPTWTATPTGTTAAAPTPSATCRG